MAENSFPSLAALESLTDRLPSSGGDSGALMLRLGPHRAVALRPGFPVSIVLHALVALFLFYRLGVMPPAANAPIIPVDLVLLDHETFSPQQGPDAAPQRPKTPALQPRPKTSVPSQPAPAPKVDLASNIPPVAVAPKKIEPVPDTLQSKLEALAKLRQPDSDSRLQDGGASTQSASGNGAAPGPYTAYSVKDFVRAQVERRWNLDLRTLGSHNFVIPIHVVMHRDGTIVKAEIVYDRRYRYDPIYHSVALSARNAVLLSSPLTMPAGNYDEVMDMTLNLNPRDTLR